MKIITLHQPWASLVALGLKSYETRHWPTSYRGALLIHAAKRRMRKSDLAMISIEVESFPLAEQMLEEAFELIQSDPSYGCIVAIAQLTNCRLMVDVDEFFENPNAQGLKDQPININSIDEVPLLEKAVGLWEVDRYAFQLENVTRLPDPILFTSSLQGKLLDAPVEVVAAVRAQLKGVA